MDYYPKTDKEIRMYCLEYIRDPFNMAKSEDIINSAQRIYDFICQKPNSVTEMSCVETDRTHATVQEPRRSFELDQKRGYVRIYLKQERE